MASRPGCDPGWIYRQEENGLLRYYMLSKRVDKGLAYYKKYFTAIDSLNCLCRLGHLWGTQRT